MQKLVIISLIIVAISCDSPIESKPQSITGGYAILNQGSISSIDYFDLKKDSLISGIFQLNNNAETLSGYAEHIYQDEKYIFVSIQGGFTTGDGSKVVVLNKNFEHLAEITDRPLNANALYLSSTNNDIFVSYRIVDSNYNYSYILRKYKVTDNSGSITIVQTGSDLNLGLSGFNAGRYLLHNDLIYIYSDQSVQIVDAKSLTITKTIQFAKPIRDISYSGNSIYAAIFNLSAVVNDEQDIVNGGLYIIENCILTDSIIENYAYTKLLNSANRLFGIRWTGTGRSINWPYMFSNLITEMVEITTANEVVLFEESSLASISDLWMQFQYDSKNDLFLLPGSTDFTTSSFYIRNSDGSLLRKTNHPGQASSAIIIEE